MAGRTFDFPQALVERAVDGDSLEVTCFWELPFYLGVMPPGSPGSGLPCPIRLRIAGVDCWDSRTPRGAAAKARTTELCQGRVLHVQTFGAYTYGVGTAKRLGEWMGDVILETSAIGAIGDRRLSDALLSEGLALPYDGKGRRPTLGLPGDWPVAETAGARAASPKLERCRTCDAKGRRHGVLCPECKGEGNVLVGP